MPSALPPGLSKYRAYLDRGAELARGHPLAAYHCRLQYLTIAVHLKPSLQLSRDEQISLLSLMDELEVEKGQLDTAEKAALAQYEKARQAHAEKVRALQAEAEKAREVRLAQELEEKAKLTTEAKDVPASTDGAPDASKDAPSADGAAAQGKDAGEGAKDAPKDTQAAPPAAPALPAAPAPPPTTKETIRALARSIFDRSRASDKPDAYPSAATKWSIAEAPAVARGLHAAAVLLDTLTQFGPLSADDARLQRAAHARSQQLSTQLSRALKTEPVVPADWTPMPPTLLTDPPPQPSLAQQAVVAPPAEFAFPAAPSAPPKPPPRK